MIHRPIFAFPLAGLRPTWRIGAGAGFDFVRLDLTFLAAEGLYLLGRLREFPLSQQLEGCPGAMKLSGLMLDLLLQIL